MDVLQSHEDIRRLVINRCSHNSDSSYPLQQFFLIHFPFLIEVIEISHLPPGTDYSLLNSRTGYSPCFIC